MTRDLAAATAQIGQFTATASLAANFNAVDDLDDEGGRGSLLTQGLFRWTLLMPVTGAGMVSGAITDFKKDGDPLYNWHVTLGNGASLAPHWPERSMSPGEDAGSRTPTVGTGMTSAGESTIAIYRYAPRRASALPPRPASGWASSTATTG